MKVKFNKYERAAGLFVLSTLLGGILTTAFVAVKQGWFENRIRFETTLQNADGIHMGTLVHMAGLRAGSVISVDLKSNNAVHVVFEISEKYHNLVREDSVVRMLRPFIISEKVVEISVGNLTLPQAKAGAELRSEQTADIMDLISGRTLAPYFDSMSKMAENLRMVVEAILDPNRSRDIIKIFDELRPLVQNMNSMSKQVSDVLRDSNKDKKLVHMLTTLNSVTEELNRLLPEMNKVMPEVAKVAPDMLRASPKVAADMAKIASNLAVLSDEMNETLPVLRETFAAVGPDMPRGARRAMEALDEMVVTLKALQKSFILRGNAQEVRDEEAQREAKREADKDKKRNPANQPSVLTPEKTENDKK
jgi:phospholipid/cholesterol/gamma-HCH transport system substrate-binding protein